MNLERMILGEAVRTTKGVAQDSKSADAKAADGDAAEFAELIDKANRDGSGKGDTNRGLSEPEAKDGESSDATVVPHKLGRERFASLHRLEFEAVLDGAVAEEPQEGDALDPQIADDLLAFQDSDQSEGVQTEDADAVASKSGGQGDRGGKSGRNEDGVELPSNASENASKLPASQVAQHAVEVIASAAASQHSRIGEGQSGDAGEVAEKPSQPEEHEASRFGLQAQAKAANQASAKGGASKLFADVPEILQSLEQVSLRRPRGNGQSGDEAAANPASVKARVVGQETHLPVVPQWRLEAQNRTAKPADATQLPDEGDLTLQSDSETEAQPTGAERSREKRNVRANIATDIVKDVRADARNDANQPGVAQQLGERIREALKTPGAQASNDLSRLERINQPTQTQGSQLVKILDVELTPEHLGSVTVRLSLKGDALSVHVTSGSQAALAQLDSDKEILTEVLKRSGYSVDEVVIVKSEFEPTRHNIGHVRHDAEPQIQRSDFSRAADGDKGTSGMGQEATRDFDHGRNGGSNHAQSHENFIETGGEASGPAQQDPEDDPGRSGRGIVI